MTDHAQASKSMIPLVCNIRKTPGVRCRYLQASINTGIHCTIQPQTTLPSSNRMIHPLYLPAENVLSNVLNHAVMLKVTCRLLSMDVPT
jgi:hypothetical protein